jgi:NifU-like protein involved in Fe-S cluster formation
MLALRCWIEGLDEGPWEASTPGAGGVRAEADPVLADEVGSPRWRPRLERPDGSGLVTDPGGGNAVRIALAVREDTVVDASFHALGARELFACCSFAVEAILGECLGAVLRLHEDALAWALRLPVGKAWCAGLVVEALEAAVRDARRRRRADRKRSTGRRPGAPGGRRKEQGAICQSRGDRRMLRPDERMEELHEERGAIVGALHNLDRLMQIGDSALYIHDTATNRAREELLAFRAGLVPLLGRLSEKERRLVALIGLLGATEEEAGRALGISQQAVHKRVWAVARKVQKMERGRSEKKF